MTSRAHHKIGVLSSRHLVVKYAGIRGADVGLKAAVEHADLAPIQIQCLDISISNARAQSGLLKGHTNSTHRRLRGQTGHA